MILPSVRHAVYEGQVAHARLRPHRHAFRYPISFVYLNLDELASAFAGRWLWSCARPAAGWFRRADHTGDPQQPLAETVRELVRAAGHEANGPVCILTQLRYWGFVMNPVSFYYCFNAAGTEVTALVAEVHNTPWGETHCYVLPAQQPAEHFDETETWLDETWLDKEFHVSPFLPMAMRYRFRFSSPAKSLQMHIANYAAEAEVFNATLSLQRRPWTTFNLQRLLWIYPLQTQAVYAGIYWQALQLWWKKTPYFPHPDSTTSAVTRT